MLISCCNSDMDIQDTRRSKLQAMVDAEGLSVVAKKFKKPDRQIKDMLERRKSFGEKVARQMELNYDPTMPAGWLDKKDAIKSDDDLLSILGLSRESLDLGQIERIRSFVKSSKEHQVEAILKIKVLEIEKSKKSGK